MARRIRNIKPEFFEDEVIAKLPFAARLLFIGMWTRADMGGVLEYNVKVITAAIFPHDDDVTANDVQKWLDALEGLGRIRQFEVKGKRYAVIPQFTEHQAISKAEKDKGRQYPRPVFGTVPGTVLETPDEGLVTRDNGRWTKDSANFPDPSLDDEIEKRQRQIEDIMAADTATSAKVAAEPMKPSWLDWRASHALVGIARTGEDGDGEAWRHLWNTYGAECFDPMYTNLVKRLALGKKIWYSMAAEWLNKNTKEVA